MNGLEGVKSGEILHVAGFRQNYTVVVAKVGRVWVTDTHGDRYRITDGRGESTVGAGVTALTVAQEEARLERRRLDEVFSQWGLSGRKPQGEGHMLTPQQRYLIVALLASFQGREALAAELARWTDRDMLYALQEIGEWLDLGAVAGRTRLDYAAEREL
jgi:hypothetical protein